jgi:thioredoxin-related protein
MKISRRLLLSSLILLLPFFMIAGCESASPSSLVTTNNLAELATEAKKTNIPIMLFVSAPDCHYCHQLERSVIAPMLKNARYPQFVLLRRFNLGADQVVDFDNTVKDPLNIAARYHAQLTPTIIFLSADGERLTDNIIGVAANLDLYGGMIDSRINQALSRLGNPAQLNHQTTQ